MRISDGSSDVCSSDLKALADLDAVQPRQHQVEHDHVVGVFGREAIDVETVGGVIDLEAAAFQVLAHHLRDVAVVLDAEDELARFRCSKDACSSKVMCWECDLRFVQSSEVRRGGKECERTV